MTGAGALVQATSTKGAIWATYLAAADGSSLWAGVAGGYSEAARHLTPGNDADFYRHPKEGNEGLSGQTQWRTAIFPVPEGSDWEPMHCC